MTGKRASMREGPLADLFRKTAAETSEPVRGQAEARRSPRRPSRPLASRRARAARARAARTPSPRREPVAARSRPPPSRHAETPSRRRAFHPSFEAEVPPVADEPARQIPSAQERLQQAFSADIPENVLDAPAGRPTPADVRRRGRAGRLRAL